MSKYFVFILILLGACATTPPDVMLDPCFQEPDSYLKSPLVDTSAIVSDVDVKAEIIGNPAAGIRYPRPARSWGITGIVEAELTISKNGDLQEVTITKSLGYCTDQEVVKLLKGLSYKPAEKDGETVRSILIYPVHFNLQSDR